LRCWKAPDSTRISPDLPTPGGPDRTTPGGPASRSSRIFSSRSRCAKPAPASAFLQSLGSRSKPYIGHGLNTPAPAPTASAYRPCTVVGSTYVSGRIVRFAPLPTPDEEAAAAAGAAAAAAEAARLLRILPPPRDRRVVRGFDDATRMQPPPPRLPSSAQSLQEPGQWAGKRGEVARAVRARGAGQGIQGREIRGQEPRGCTRVLFFSPQSLLPKLAPSCSQPCAPVSPAAPSASRESEWRGSTLPLLVN